MTWTRAQCQHVYSQWQAPVPGNGAADDAAANAAGVGFGVGVDPPPSTPFLNEIDVALEAIDVVVTPLLLDHLRDMAQPLLVPKPLIEFYLILAIFTEYYLDLPSFTESYWVLLGFT